MKKILFNRSLMIIRKSFLTTRSCNSILLKRFTAIQIIFLLGMTLATSSVAQNPCAKDQTTNNFDPGTFTKTYISETGDGEVILKPAAGAEFFTLPPVDEWNSFLWDAPGSATVSAGKLSVDAARFNTEPEALTFGPGTSVEFVATFAEEPFQHIGFGGGTDNGPGGIYNAPPWAMLSTGANGTNLLARTHNGTDLSNVIIPGSFLGDPHLYRIEWTETAFKYFIDGALVHTESTVLITEPMRVAISDFNVGGGDIVVDWIRVSPYASSGNFESRVFDGGSQRSWGVASWTADVPAGTALSLFVRTGNTSTPDGTWTNYSPISNGEEAGAISQYIQYRADFSASNQDLTPVLKDFEINCSDASEPNITTQPQSQTACPGSGVTFSSAATGAPIPKVQWQVSINDGGTWSDINGATSGTLNFTATSSDNGNQYRAVWTNNAGSANSSAATLNVLVASIASQTDVSCKDASDGSVTINATGGTPPYKYKIKGGVFQSNNTFSGLAAGKYTVSVKDKKKCLAKVKVVIKNSTIACTSISAVTSNKSSVNNSDRLDAKVFPNPSANSFTLSARSKSNASIEVRVTDMFGRVVYKTRGPVNQSYYFGQGYATGVYLLEIRQGKSLKTLKIVKQ
ncbi:MAG TPA: T9SS type A sorting domain-containing protein [Chitinophagaceae bacterium]